MRKLSIFVTSFIIVSFLFFSLFYVQIGSGFNFSAKAVDKLKILGFYSPKRLTPFMTTAWNKEIENLPIPTAYWPMKEGAGTNIEDTIGGNDLTLSNAAAWRQAGDRLVGPNLVPNGGFEDFTGTADNHLGDEILVNPDFENVSDGTDLADNGGFEDAGAGGADIWANWSEVASDGALANETTIIHGGSDAAKITAGASVNTRIAQTISVVPSTTLKYSFWTRGDGTHDGRYYVYDETNAATIITWTATGITGTDYTEITDTLNVPTGCVSLSFFFYCPSTEGGIAYFDDFTFKQQDVDGWTKSGMTEGSAGKTAPKAGTWHAVVVDDDEESSEGILQNVTLITDIPYKLSLWKRRNTGSGVSAFGILDLADASYDSGVNYNNNVENTNYLNRIKYFKTADDITGHVKFSGATVIATGTTFYDSTSLKRIFNDDFNGITENSPDWGWIDADTSNNSEGTYCAELRKGAGNGADVSLTWTVSGLTVGERYHVYFKAMSDTVGTGSFSITGIGGASDSIADTDVTMTWFEFEFIATDTTHDLVIASETAGGSIFVDEVSCWHQLDDAVGTLPLSHNMVECTPIEEYYRYGTTHYAYITGPPVQAGGDLNFDGATAGTWMGWVYLRDMGEGTHNYKGHLARKYAGSTLYFGKTDEIGFSLFDSGGIDTSYTTSSPIVPSTGPNKWFFVAFIYDGSVPEKRIYVGDLNGNLILQTLYTDNIEATLVDSEDNLYIGDANTNVNAINGYLAHIVIYNGTALTVNQIRLWQRLTGGIITGVAPRADIGFDDFPLKFAFTNPYKNF